MNIEGFDKLRSLPPAIPIRVSIADVSGPDRTLVYGYTCSRDTFHVYKLDDELHILVYDHLERTIKHVSGRSLQAQACAPDKRVYPESCDFEFAVLLHEREVRLPFLPFSSTRYSRVHEQQFHGHIRY